MNENAPEVAFQAAVEILQKFYRNSTEILEIFLYF